MVYKVTLNGRTYEVEVEAGQAILLEEYEAVAPAAPAVTAVTAAGEPVVAPMPGTILKVNVQNGQAVKEGDLLCVLEAMKMENEIFAPKAGTVAQVVVSKGASVDTGATLVVLA